MNAKRFFHVAGQAGRALTPALLVMLAGCTSSGERPAVGSVYEEPFLVQDDYVYYPNYQCYYSVSRHQYAYREGNNWVIRPTPPHVTVPMVQASPSVKMNFHDSPANHHATVVKQYPKSWKPPVAKQDQKQKDYPHGEKSVR